MSTRSGFTLIELMIVISIIAIICAIMLPGLVRSRLQSNEASAIQNLRTIMTGQIGYQAAHNTYASFDDLVNDYGGDGKAFLPAEWTQDVEKSGYRFTMDAISESNFTCYADPVNVGITGNRYFYVDGQGVIRQSPSGRPDAASDPID